jgi:hypothetical protein
MIWKRAVGALIRRKIGLCAFSCLVLASLPARAGHEPLVPEPRTILLREGHPEHVVVGTRRGGYFSTRDSGATWSWMCEAGVGYEDEEVYPGVLLQSGSLLVSTGFGGVARSPDGCGFTPWLPSAQPFVADLRLRPDAREAIALEAHADGDGFVNQLWQSSDDAQTWQPLGGPFAPDTLATSLAISNNGDLYVAGAGASGAELLRSDSSAASWSRSVLTSELGVVPRVVGATAGAGTSRVFVVLDYAQAEGLITPGDRLVMSLDGGTSFVPLLDAVGDLPAASLSPDGERLAAGGESDGIHVLDAAASAGEGASLNRVSDMGVHALAWGADGRLYAAGHEAEDGFSLGVSDDAGRTFSALFALCQVSGPLSCAPDTSVGASCQSSGETGWDVRKEVAASEACAEDATTGGSGEPTTPATGSDPAPGQVAQPSDLPASDDHSQSATAGGCTLSPARAGASDAWLAVLVAVARLFGRRRWRIRSR